MPSYKKPEQTELESLKVAAEKLDRLLTEKGITEDELIEDSTRSFSTGNAHSSFCPTIKGFAYAKRSRRLCLAFGSGKVKGQEITPLYRSMPEAVEENPQLYEMLAILDGLRVSKVRERELAAEELRKRLYD